MYRAADSLFSRRNRGQESPLKGGSSVAAAADHSSHQHEPSKSPDKHRSTAAVIAGLVSLVVLFILLITQSKTSSSSSALRSGAHHDDQVDPYDLIRQLTVKLTEADLRLREQEEELKKYQRKDEQKQTVLEKEDTTLQHHYPKPFHMMNQEADCDDRFGLGLADIMASKKVTICEEDGNNKALLPSSMECYPHNPPHKSNRDRPWDMFCVAYNFFIDFSKVKLSM